MSLPHTYQLVAATMSDAANTTYGTGGGGGGGNVQLEDYQAGSGFDINAGASYFVGSGGDLDTITAVVVLEFFSDGAYTFRYLYGETGCGGGPSESSNAQFTWLLSGSAGDYSARFDVETGQNFTSGDSANTAYNLGSNPPYYELCSESAFGASSNLTLNGTLKILDSGNNVLVSKLVQITADTTNSD